MICENDNVMIDMLLAPMKEINAHNIIKYENKVETSRAKKMKEMSNCKTNINKQKIYT